MTDYPRVVLGQVFPCLATNNIRYMSRGRAVLVSQHVHGDLAGHVFTTDGGNHRGSQASTVYTLASCHPQRVPRGPMDSAAGATPFIDAIRDVISVGAQPQMLWVAAPRMVAMVQDMESNRDRAVREHPGDTVGEDMAPAPIAFGESIATPRPAVASAVHCGPEGVYLKSRPCDMLCLHADAPYRCAMPPSVSAVRGQLAAGL